MELVEARLIVFGRECGRSNRQNQVTRTLGSLCWFPSCNIHQQSIPGSPYLGSEGTQRLSTVSTTYGMSACDSLVQGLLPSPQSREAEEMFRHGLIKLEEPQADEVLGDGLTKLEAPQASSLFSDLHRQARNQATAHSQSSPPRIWPLHLDSCRLPPKLAMKTSSVLYFDRT